MNLTPDLSVSDTLADVLAANHESFIELFRILLDDPDTQRRGTLELSIKRHIQGLVDLGRPRVALDLRARGWELNKHGWRRPYNGDEYPFPTETLMDDGPVAAGWVYAENNDHARLIDGTSTRAYFTYYPENYVI